MLSENEPQWTPSKKIFNNEGLKSFRKSLAYQNIRRALFAVVEKVKGQDVPSGILNADIVTRFKPARNGGPENDRASFGKVQSEQKGDVNVTSKNKDGIVRILEELATYIDKFPPLQGARRFGNLACRDWHKEVQMKLGALLKENLISNRGLNFETFIDEQSYYLSNSFGSSIRLDYGTGHELSFLAFLGGCFSCKILDVDEVSGIDVLIMFSKYYDLVRRLILEYNLEPAGSHGVWGLDDHFHLIYIIGAAQFNDNRHAPSVQHVLSNQTINVFKTSNLYVNAISFIFKIKSGPFNEHSPIIYDIHSTVSLWAKVLSGLLKMYEVEVLNKFPVVQHFWFGDMLYPWKDNDSKLNLPVYGSDDQSNQVNSSTQTTTRNSSTVTAAPWRQPKIDAKNTTRGEPSNIQTSSNNSTFIERRHN